MANVRLGLDLPSVLVLPLAVAKALPLLSGEQLADAASGGGSSVLRRQVLAALAVQVLGMRFCDVRLIADTSGRRMLAGHPVFASVGLRAGWVAAALSRRPIGIDIEISDEINADAGALAGVRIGTVSKESFCGPAGIWASKEAALKAIGRDLTNDPGDWRLDRDGIAAGSGEVMQVEFRQRDNAIVAFVVTAARSFPAE